MAAVVLLACKDDVSSTATTTTSSAGGGGIGGEGIGGEPSWIVPTGSGGCDTILYEPPNQGQGHVEECSKVTYWSNPPSSGPHYPKWALFKTYDEAFPRGYYVHSMEHGAVVLAYKCTGDCTREVAAIQALVDALPGDPLCPDGAGGGPPGTGGAGGGTSNLIRTRVIIVPDPLLDVPFAATAWGNMLKAQCFDADLVGEFISAHYAKAPEDGCFGGIDPTDPASRIPPDCGE
jgi:uncharacterized protein DUF3105